MRIAHSAGDALAGSSRRSLLSAATRCCQSAASSSLPLSAAVIMDGDHSRSGIPRRRNSRRARPAVPPAPISALRNRCPTSMARRSRTIQRSNSKPLDTSA